jgi:hypothetical protein
MKILKAIFALMLIAALITSCSDGRVSSDGDLLIDKQTNITYRVAPSCYEPVALGKEHSRSNKQGYEKIYYLLGELSGNEWLTDSEYNVYRALGVKLPTLEEMNCQRMLVCEEGDTLVSINDVTDAQSVKALINAYLNGERAEYIGLKADSVLKLKLRSALYPYIQYSLTYYEYENGCILKDTTDDIASYKYLTDDDGVEISVEQNADGSYTVTYNYGKYFIRNESDGTFVRVGQDVYDIIRG